MRALAQVLARARGRARACGPARAPSRALGLVLAALAWAAPAAATAEPCSRMTHEGRGYAVCAVQAGDPVRLWLRDAEGSAWSSFDRLARSLAARGERLVFAMNAGMYHADRSPVGLYVEDGVQEGRLSTRRGPGNFHMLPNGVFCVAADGGFAVIESLAFAATPPACRHASQSGPMLVIDGQLHPRFLVDATSRLRRNGVGVSADGRQAFFVISDGGVTFHEFARVFRDVLGTPQALYFDGNVSRLYAPGLGRADAGRPMGPIVGMAVPAGAAGVDPAGPPG